MLIRRLLTCLLAVSLVLAPLPVLQAATGTIAPMPKALCLDSNGLIVSGGLIFTYTAGTTTKATTYSDAAMTTPNANPVVCDSAGRATIFLPAQAFKFTYAPSTDTDPPTNAYFTVDNIAAVPYVSTDLDITGTAGEALTANDAVYLSDGSGGNTAGRWYKADADFTYASTTAQALGFAVANISSAASGSIRLSGRLTGLAGLASGSTYYISATAGAITSTPPANQRAVGVADSGTTLVISTWLTQPFATATVAGIVSTTTQSFGGAKTFTGAATVQGAFTASSATAASFGASPTFTAGTGSGTSTTTGVITTNVTPAGNTGAGETDLMSYTVPANTLSANGKALRVTFGGTLAATAVTKRIRVKFGASTVLDITTAASAGTTRFSGQCTITRLTATTQATQGLIYERDTGAATVDYDVVNPGETLSGTVVLKLTGLATNTNDIIQTFMVVETVG